MKKEIKMKPLGYRHANQCIKPQHTDCKHYMKGYELAVNEMERQVKQSQVIRGIV